MTTSPHPRLPSATRRFLPFLSFLFLLTSLAPLARAEENKVLEEMSPFGIGSCHATSYVPEKWVPEMAAIGVKECRSTQLSWSVLEPKPNQWEWASLDKRLKVFADNGVRTGGLLIGYPKWAKGWKAGAGMPLNDLEGWANYVEKTVSHCKDQIRFWEVWNEPPNFTGKDQTAADYGKLVATAYDAAKKADPSTKIGLAAKSAHIQYLQDAINAGAKNKFDYVTLHPYESLGGVTRGMGTEPVFMTIVPYTHKMLARVNPEKAGAPVIWTEFGINAGPKNTRHGQGQEGQAHGLVKAFAMGIAQGVTCINWFEGMDGDSGPMGLLTREGTPRLAYTAMGQMTKHLGEHPEYLGWTRLDGKHYAFFFQGPAGPVLVTWAYKNQPGEVDFGQAAKVVDPLTGNVTETRKTRLTGAPVIVLGPGEKLLAEAKANKGKPLLWDGHDYSKDKSVSISFENGKTIERGLHTNAADDVAADVVAYGGGARAGDVPGGNVFIVDPTFLGGEPTPVRITVVSRRNENNDRAGFNLNYEGPGRNGYKNGPRWYEVPDNKEWHTVTYDLPDAYFVYMWGFNFALNSDGSKFNKYYLKSVTVEKLPPEAALKKEVEMR